jgi:predicted PurR-regulated permease PerM
MAIERRTRRPASSYPHSRHLWEIAAARDVAVLLLSALFLSALYWLRGLFLPVLLAAILAHLVNPVVTLLETRARWPRPLTASLILASGAFAFAGFLVWLGPVLYDQVVSLVGNFPGYVRALSDRYGIEIGSIFEGLDSSRRELSPEQLLSQVFKTTGKALGIVTVAFSTAAYFFVALPLFGIYFVVLSWHFNTGAARLKEYLPASRKERLIEIFGKMEKAIADFFRGRLLIAVIMGVLLSAGWLWSGVPYWFFLGMLTGILNIVPYLSLLTWPVAVLLKYFDAMAAGVPGDWLAAALWPSLVYLAVQFLENWVLTPWIQSGGHIKMSPATILLVVLIGGWVAGVWGLLFAIPVAACIKIVLDEVVLPRIRQWAAEH